jgi:hypothetical protein
LAVIVVATMPLFIINSRTVIFDIALAFFVSAAIFAGFRAEETEAKSRRNWYLLGALAAGLATLVKGPVGFLIPGLVLLVFYRVDGRRGAWKRLFAPLNFIVFFGVTLPWFIGLSLQHPDFPYYGLVEESFHRFTTTSFHRSQPFYFYGLIVAGLFLPWSLILPETIIATWQNKKSLLSADRLCLVWAIVVVIFFSLSKSKLPGYILTVTVACGILTARLFENAMAFPGGRAERIINRAALTMAILSFLVAVAGFILSPHLGSFAKPLRLSVSDATEMGHDLIVPGIMLFIFAVLGLLAHFRRDIGLCFFTFAILPVFVFALGFGMIAIVFNTKSARELSQKIQTLTPDTKLAFLECFPSGLPFYLERTAPLITRDGNEITSASNYILFSLKHDPAWPANLVPLTNFDQWISQRKTPIYLVTRDDERAKLEEIGVQPADIHPLTPPYIGVLLTPQ